MFRRRFRDINGRNIKVEGLWHHAIEDSCVKIILKVFLFININFNASEYSKNFDCIIRTEFSLLKAINFKKAERQKIRKTHDPKPRDNHYLHFDA